jgi:hypothetical protein
MHKLSLVVTDLDGTLLNSNSKVSDVDLATLNMLGEEGIVRVIATGRSPYSFEKVIDKDFPIDYLIFSSGAGIMHWQKKNILYSTELESSDIQNVVDELILHNVDFMVHEPIPANHLFLYHYTGSDNNDFLRRVEIYKPFCQPYIPGIPFDTNATQILAVLPHNVDWFENLKNRFPLLKVIRATSPLDGHSIWMEIFPRDVSKAHGIRWICNELNINLEEVIAIGNDFNDLDMLCSVKRSYVVDNSPHELKTRFLNVKSNNDSGFSHAVEMAMNEGIR